MSAWVEPAVRQLRAATEYQQRIKDEWYETLPVPGRGADQRPGVWVALGPQVGAPPQRRPQAPQWLVFVRWPDADAVWHPLTTTQATGVWQPGATWPVQAPPSGSLMVRRRAYYQAVDQLLALGGPPQPRAAAEGSAPAPWGGGLCESLRTGHTALLAAAPAGLAPFYQWALGQWAQWRRQACPGA